MARSFLPENIRKRMPQIIAGVLTAYFLLLGAWRLNLTDVNFLTRIEFLWMDQKFRIRDWQQPGPEVVLVTLDDKTLDRIGSARVFQRHHMATTIDKLAEMKPKVIGFDMVYPDSDPTSPENDKKFADAIRRAGNVVLGIYLQLESEVGERRQSTELTPELMDLVVQKQVFPAELRGPGASDKLEDLIQGKTLQLAITPLMDAAYSFGFVNFHRDPEGGLLAFTGHSARAKVPGRAFPDSLDRGQPHRFRSDRRLHAADGPAWPLHAELRRPARLASERVHGRRDGR
jgi:hypothetical protein